MAGSPFAAFFRRDIAAMARSAVAPRPERLLVRASTGAPGWAAVPWLAWFAPHVTRSMRHGLYVACFLNARDERLILSLQHGAADALRDHGQQAGLSHLRIQARATCVSVGLPPQPEPELGSDAPLVQGYAAGSALWHGWDAHHPDPARFDAALHHLLDLYRLLVGPQHGS